MDRAFARCVDHIALQDDADGTPLLLAAHAALGAPPRAAQLRWLAAAFAARRAAFSSPDWAAAPAALRLTCARALCDRALGHSPLEHPPLPPKARALLRHVGRAGPAGVLQSELAALSALRPVMVSHYLGTLSARALVARKKVVLTVTRPGRDLRAPTSVTYTAVIVLARHAAALAAADAAHPRTDARPPATPGRSVAEVNVERGAARVLAALRPPPHVRPQRDLKALALPDAERPLALAREVFQRKRHRAFRAIKSRLEKQGLVLAVERRCVDAAGRAKGLLRCLQLTNAGCREAGCEPVDAHPLPEKAAPVLVKMEEEEDGEGEADDEGEGAGGRGPHAPRVLPVPEPEQIRLPPIVDNATQVATDKVPDLPANDGVPPPEEPSEDDNRPHFLAEVDVIEQIYQLLHRAGSRGMSVPEITAYLDAGTGLTCAPQKRVRNIINSIKARVPVVESQRFEGSAMHLKICLAEFSDLNGVLPSARKTAIAKMSMTGEGNSRAHRNAPSELARKKNELTSLGLQRQERVAELLQERKAIVIESLGREIARLENSGLHRVDQKVMRRIIDELVADRRAHVITTMKPSIKESSRWQTIRLVVLPHLNEKSPEVKKAISLVVARALYGDDEDSYTPQKRKAEDEKSLTGKSVTKKFKSSEVLEAKKKKGAEKKVAEKKVAEKKVAEKQENLSTATSRKRPRSTNAGKSDSHTDNRLDAADADDVATELTPGAKRAKDRRSLAQSSAEDEKESSQAKEAVVVHAKKDVRLTSIWRLRAVDCGWMKGKMARLRKFHEKLYDIACGGENSCDEACPPVHHSTIEVSRTVEALGAFTIFSCLRDFTVADYAATVGIYQEHGDIIDSIADERIADVIDILRSELQSNAASRQIQGLVHGLVRLNLMESSMDAKWVLCGAGLIRDFGRGLPPRVLPHGILFSSRRAVQEYWRELEQFSLLRCSKVPGEELETPTSGTKSEDLNSKKLQDVYVRSKWSKGLEHSYVHTEQLHYEAMLQELSGVKVSTDEAGDISTSNFIVTRLRRMTVEEMFDHVLGKTGGVVCKTDAERTSRKTEKLMFYARFRAENLIPFGVCRDSELLGCAPCDSASPPAKADTVPTLRLCRGRSLLNPTVENLPHRSSKRSVRKSLVRYNHDLRKRSAEERREAWAEIHVDVNKCVDMLKRVIRQRSITYRRGDGETLKWKVTGMLTSLIEEEMSHEEGKPLEKDDDKATMQFRQGMVAICESGIVQGIVDGFALRMAVMLSRGCPPVDTQRLCKEAETMQESMSNMSFVLRAAILESQKQLQETYRITLRSNEGDELRSAATRRKVFEREFQLNSNMRFRQDYSIGQQFALLVERYLVLLSVNDRTKLWHGFIFRDKEVEEVWSPGDEDAASVRPELMEQVLTGILRRGGGDQSPSEALNTLTRFRLCDIEQARNRLLVRGVISLSTTAEGRRFFKMSSLQKYKELDVEKTQFWHDNLEMSREWEKTLLSISNSNEATTGFTRLRDTEFGRAAFSLKDAPSLVATALTTNWTFFPYGRDSKLELRGTVDGKQSGRTPPVDNQDAEGGGNLQEDERRLSMDVEFRFVTKSCNGKCGAEHEATEHDAEADDESEEQAKQREKVEELVRSCGHDGILLSELLKSSIAQSLENKTGLVRAVHRMLRRGAAHRFSIETGGLPSATDDKAWTNGEGVLYIWHTDADALQVSQDSRETGQGLLCVWRSGSSSADDAYARSVAAIIMHLVTRAPGMQEWRVVREVQTHMGGLPARSIADMVFALERAGALRRSVVRRAAEADGPFAASMWQARGRDERRDLSERFVDGAAILGDGGGGRCEACLHAVPGAVAAVGAEAVCRVGAGDG